jgi:hypothetical protein
MASSIRLYVFSANGQISVQYGSTTSIVHPVNEEFGSGMILIMRRQGNSAITFADGSQIGSGTATFGVSSLFSIGANHLGGNCSESKISELLFVKSAKEIEDRQRMEGYLAHMWGLVNELPPDHPYKVSSPTGPDPTYAAMNAFDTNGSTETRLSQSGPADTTYITADAGSNITVAGFDTYVQNFIYPLTIRLLTGATPSGPWSLHAEQVLATYPAENQLLRFNLIQTTFRYFKVVFIRADFDSVRMHTFQFYNREYSLTHPQSEILELFDRNNSTFCVLEGHTSPSKTSFVEVDLGGSITVSVRTDSNGHIVKRITAPLPMRRELQRFHLLLDGPSSGIFVNTPSGDLVHTYVASYADKQAGEGDAITTHMTDGTNELRLVVVDDKGRGVNALFSAVLAIDGLILT